MSAEIGISAVIPAYNAAAFLPAAVASVRAQTCSVHEIVVVDDGSSDATVRVARQLGGDITVVAQRNSGPSAARNLGVQASSGAFIAFLDADDVWLPDAIASQMRILERSPEVALTTGDMSAIDESGQVTILSWFAHHGLAERVCAWDSKPVPRAVAEIVRKNFVGTSVVIVQREAFETLGGFRTDLRYGEDLELWARIAARYPVVCLPQVLGLRRSHRENTTKSTEPMLRGLVETCEVVRRWGGKILARQGSNADALVAGAKTDLGYWYFSQNRMVEARGALRSALADRVTERALRYLVLSVLPPRALDRLRQVQSASMPS